MKIAIIGAGNLGLSIAKGIIKSDLYKSLYITKRNINAIKELKTSDKIHLTSDNQEAIINSDVIILAIQPYQLEEILIQNKNLFTNEKTIISVVLGYTTENIEKIIGFQHPIIRAMPNTAIAVGQSMTCICSNKSGVERMKLALNIFNSLGHTLEIAEKHMSAATVICGSGIAFWMRMIRATTEGAVEMGLEADEALEMAIHSCLGAAKLLKATKNNPEQEIDKVTTPGGCTITGLNEMEHHGLSSSIIKGLVASFHKVNHITDK